MLGRRQEINLQLTELADSAILAASLWVAYVLRAYVLQSWFPELEIIPPFKDFFWVAAVLVPFTPIVLEARGFYTHLLHKTPVQSLRQLADTLVWMGMVIGAFVVFFRWEVPSRSVVLIQIPVAGALLLLREAYHEVVLHASEAARALPSRTHFRARLKHVGAQVATLKAAAGPGPSALRNSHVQLIYSSPRGPAALLQWVDHWCTGTVPPWVATHWSGALARPFWKTDLQEAVRPILCAEALLKL
jgi:hypothetical protein